MRRSSEVTTSALVPLACLLLIAGQTGCQSSSKLPQDPIASAPPLSPSTPMPVVPLLPPLEVKVPGETETKNLIARPITASGENTEARFSQDGSKIVFVSRGRTSHRLAQGYELDLIRMTERRLTYNDGDVAGPIYLADGMNVVYASTTDELKEEPVALERVMKAYLSDKQPLRSSDLAGAYGPYELYLQRLDSRQIDRLTNVPGFDAEADADLKGRRIAFVSTRAGRPHLFLFDDRGQSPLTQGDVADHTPRFSADGRWLAWSRQATPNDADSKKQIESRIFVAEHLHLKNARALSPEGARDLYPAWHPSGDVIVFASNRLGKTFDLYTIDRAGTCLKRLTEVETDLLQPSFSPDGSRLVFSARRDNQIQLHLMDYKPPKDCLALKAP